MTFVIQGIKCLSIHQSKLLDNKKYDLDLWQLKSYHFKIKTFEPKFMKFLQIVLFPYLLRWCSVWEMLRALRLLSDWLLCCRHSYCSCSFRICAIWCNVFCSWIRATSWCPVTLSPVGPGDFSRDGSQLFLRLHQLRSTSGITQLCTDQLNVSPMCVICFYSQSCYVL